MATYLLKWDPTKWDWHNISELAQAVKMGVPVSKAWSCGMARRIVAGDRVFLIRQGREPRGIIASGQVTRGSYEAPHLEAQDTGRGKKGNLFVDVRFDVLAEPRREALLPRNRLNEGVFSSFVWDIQTSGVQIPDNVAAELEKVWFERAFPEEAAKRREEESRRAEEQEAEERRRREVEEQARRQEEERRHREAEAARRARKEEERRQAEERQRREAAEHQAREEAARKAEEQRLARSRAEPEPAPRKLQTGPFSMKECIAVVADYFTMLRAEIHGQLYSKADHRNRLSQELGRDPDEIEDYYRGVGAILGALGMPFIDAYKPKAVEDSQLEAAIQAFIEKQPDKVEDLWIDDDASRVSIPVELDDSKAFWVSTPSPSGHQGFPRLNWSPAIGMEVDFRKREGRNYNLAMAGERFVLAFERARLREAGRKDLVEKIEWTSQNRGTDLGYDIKSFDEQGRERCIAVKTTNFGPRFPFALSIDEIAFSRQRPDAFALYRVFSFSKGARLYMLEGKLEEHLSLSPVVYRASL